jgi:hypothetical protein
MRLAASGVKLNLKPEIAATKQLKPKNGNWTRIYTEKRINADNSKTYPGLMPQPSGLMPVMV